MTAFNTGLSVFRAFCSFWGRYARKMMPGGARACSTYRGVYMRSIVYIPMLTVVLLTAAAVGCSGDDPMVDRMVELEDTVFEGQRVSDERIEEIEREVRRYREIVDQQVQANGQLMIYYRMLGIRYLEREMYGPAVRALEQALEITPANAQLHSYYAAAAAQSAKGRYDMAEQNRLFGVAEQAYQRALQLDPNLRQALYGYAVLLVFELDRPGDALPHLDRLLEVQRQHTDGRFLRAYAHAALGNIQEAIGDYDAIIDVTRNPEVRREASRLRSQLAEAP